MNSKSSHPVICRTLVSSLIPYEEAQVPLNKMKQYLHIQPMHTLLYILNHLYITYNTQCKCYINSCQHMEKFAFLTFFPLGISILGWWIPQGNLPMLRAV